MGRVAKPLAGLRADQSFVDAGRHVIGVRAHQLFDHGDRVVDLTEPSEVHDMRVATRRLRAGLEVFGACFAGGEHEAVLVDVKMLADALGRRRDCDVAIELLDEVRDDAGGSERAAIKVVRGELERERRKANRALARALKHARRDDLEGRLKRLAS
jgi:CHAD domain-containing protein